MSLENPKIVPTERRRKAVARELLSRNLLLIGPTYLRKIANRVETKKETPKAGQ